MKLGYPLTFCYNGVNELGFPPHPETSHQSSRSNVSRIADTRNSIPLELFERQSQNRFNSLGS
ncbi:hypothetical protein GCM10009691_40160 [Brevibacterium picturae]|uniref:Uncharacterized protein n=1 Tax=Brevibacterium picturae TaxID=260553 RepID=A0ABP4NIS7_9MICO